MNKHPMVYFLTGALLASIHEMRKSGLEVMDITLVMKSDPDSILLSLANGARLRVTVTEEAG